MSFEQDYIDLFLRKRSGHMAQYVYMYRPHIYEDIIKQDSYYPFKMESDLLIQLSHDLCKNFKNVKHVLEVGPGSETPILSKTVPFLRALNSHVESFIYTAVDSTREYAEQASKLVDQHLEGIQTQALEIDFLTSNAFEDIKKDIHPDDKKLMICFGQPIFANNNDGDIEKLLKNISHFLHEDDYILFGVDTNHDEALLESAYNTKSLHDLMLNAMHHLKCTLQLEDFNTEAFDFV
ncbi:MAG: L-histidine N(alpha)-methyltransferase [Caedimonadaceae bacterium]|nr:MAG: L-histidine N(alpha)-methyltransferase [Caedimonadaceae bacterium]